MHNLPHGATVRKKRKLIDVEAVQARYRAKGKGKDQVGMMTVLMGGKPEEGGDGDPDLEVQGHRMSMAFEIDTGAAPST